MSKNNRLMFKTGHLSQWRSALHLYNHAIFTQIKHEPNKKCLVFRHFISVNFVMEIQDEAFTLECST